VDRDHEYKVKEKYEGEEKDSEDKDTGIFEA
jgi:hypothetical protein